MNDNQLTSIANKTKKRDKIASSKLPTSKAKATSSKQAKKIEPSKLSYSKRKKQEKAQRASMTGHKRHYGELRLKAKAANERMRQLEMQEIKSPAYEAVQAKLEILGRPTKGDRGRRFSETGNATYNEMELQLKILNEFLDQQTSTLTGAKQYMDDVWNTANKQQHLAEAGISRDDWLSFWSAMPAKHKDRLFASDQIVAIVRAYSMKNAKLEPEDKMSAEEIAKEIRASQSLTEAYNAVGITWKEAQRARIKKTSKG